MCNNDGKIRIWYLLVLTEQNKAGNVRLHVNRRRPHGILGFYKFKKYVYRQNKYINVKNKFHGYKSDRKGWKILQTNIIKVKLHMANSDASASR